MSEFSCMLCLQLYGRIDLPGFETRDLLRQHYEKIHHHMIPKAGESFKEARKRFLAENPEVTDLLKCKCDRCESKRRYAEQLRLASNS